MSVERQEPPDIDVDFEHERREEVIQHIYEHYRERHAALTATVISYRSRSAIREVGKVFGLSKDVIDVLTSSIWGWSMEGVTKEQALRAGLDASDPRLNQTLALANELHGFPAASFPARRRLCHLGNASRRDCSDRKRRDGKAEGDRVGQGRS